MNLYIYDNLHASFRLHSVRLLIYAQGSRIQALSFKGRQVDHFTKGRVTTLIIEPLYATIFRFDCSRPLVRDLYFLIALLHPIKAVTQPESLPDYGTYQSSQLIL